MKKILVIEDNFEVRDNLIEILSLSNYEVEGAANGVIGVEKALGNPPDLIVCDIMMPELDGYGVLHILSKKTKTADIPFVFLTAKADKTDFRKGMNLGADDYITKPFDHHELLEIIALRLKKSEQIRKSFDPTSDGLRAFIDEARGQKELEQLSKKSEIRVYRKRDIVYQEGDHARHVFFVSKGRIKTYRTSKSGKEYITHIYRKGEFLGHRPMITGSKYTESAISMEETEVALIPKKDFQALLHNHRDFSICFIKMLANDMEEKEKQLLSLAYHSLRKRVAETLVKLYEQFTADGNSSISILREDFANLVGTAKESVIRTLSEFKSEGLIDIDHGLITVIQREKLERLPY